MATVAIIGGGAGGLAAAISAAKAGSQVTIYEADERVGRSVLATGNGRCNFSNASLEVSRYFNADFVQQTFEACPPKDVLDWFSGLGLAWREEAEGRLYPVTNKASTVLDVLRRAADAFGVHVECESAVEHIAFPGTRGAESFTLHMKSGELQRADAVVLAVGGRAYELLALTGLATSKARPVLGPLACTPVVKCVNLKALDNIRVKCAVTLKRKGKSVMHERGEVLFRKYGVSGIAVFNLSRFAEDGDVISINVLPDECPESARDYLCKRAEILAGNGLPATVGDVLQGLVLPLVAQEVCAAADVALSAKVTSEAAQALAAVLCGFELCVNGIGDVRQCQVHRGGLRVEGFNPQTLESREVPGLFAIGEALDVDGPCGGYNLHWAWTSGLLAGVAAASR